MAFIVASSSPSPLNAQQSDRALQAIRHFVIIVEENRSFDNMFGLFPGANGLTNAGMAAVQVDAQDMPFGTLPAILNTSVKPPIRDGRFPPAISNAPFALEKYVSADALTSDLVHRFYPEQAQINGGKMNKFALVSNAGGLTMGYYDGRRTELWRLASRFTLSDNTFHSVYGGSMSNHVYLVCACIMRWPNAPRRWVAQADPGNLISAKEVVTVDGYVVDTARSVQFHDPANIDHDKLVPAQTLPHIGDRLDAKHISWKWYAAGYRAALRGKPDPDFQYHHQPFTYFKNMAPESPRARRHLQDLSDMYHDLETGRLPAVAFYKPSGKMNMHPGYSTPAWGDAHLAEVMAHLQASAAWKSMLVIIVYDENGGFWDHVAPPKRDRWGPGTRVPMVLAGPAVKRHFVDHTPYEFASILRTVEKRFKLQPLNSVDAKATSLDNVLTSH